MEPESRITLMELRDLGGPCPWQWEGTTDDGKEVYVRERWGTLRIDVDGATWMLKKNVEINGYDDLVRLTSKWIAYPATQATTTGPGRLS